MSRNDLVHPFDRGPDFGEEIWIANDWAGRGDNETVLWTASSEDDGVDYFGIAGQKNRFYISMSDVVSTMEQCGRE